jgi:hypothetical protein
MAGDRHTPPSSTGAPVRPCVGGRSTAPWLTGGGRAASCTWPSRDRGCVGGCRSSPHSRCPCRGAGTCSQWRAGRRPCRPGARTWSRCRPRARRAGAGGRSLRLDRSRCRSRPSPCDRSSPDRGARRWRTLVPRTPALPRLPRGRPSLAPAPARARWPPVRRGRVPRRRALQRRAPQRRAQRETERGSRGPTWVLPGGRVQEEGRRRPAARGAGQAAPARRRGG